MVLVIVDDGGHVGVVADVEGAAEVLGADEGEDEDERPVETAQRAFKSALTLPAKRSGVNGVNGAAEGERGPFAGLYKRTDKINYEFGGYDLAFASFELRQ